MYSNVAQHPSLTKGQHRPTCGTLAHHWCFQMPNTKKRSIPSQHSAKRTHGLQWYGATALLHLREMPCELNCQVLQAAASHIGKQVLKSDFGCFDSACAWAPFI
mmetsp:Transcript_72841/g.129340  ORF Transcript_72841/g.129340 Transcript_72841/m.129340 type:complete len:104 (+) Transcript_72841:40-351(+)